MRAYRERNVERRDSWVEGTLNSMIEIEKERKKGGGLKKER